MGPRGAWAELRMTTGGKVFGKFPIHWLDRPPPVTQVGFHAILEGALNLAVAAAVDDDATSEGL